ncbi:tyrosine-type recombinase/integrase [Campylobacterota bacterium DY0563]
MKVSKGTVYKKNGSPYLYINISINKKRYCVNTKFTYDKEEYVKEVELPLFRAKILTGEIVLEKVEEQINKTFEYYSEIFLNSNKYLKSSTYRRYEFNLTYFNTFFGKKEIKKIKSSDIKNFLYSLDIKPLTFRNYLNVFKRVFDEALLDDEIKENPCSRIKVPRNVKDEIEPFSIEEVNILLNNSNGFFRNYLAFAFYTGCRIGELVALKWQNIDLKNKRIYINATRLRNIENSPKTGKNRYVPIFEPLLKFIESQYKLTGLKTYVFYTERDKLINSGNLTAKYWYPLLKRVKLPKRILYNTRHTFATNMIISNQYNLNQIAYWLGHSNIKMLTEHYNKFISSDIENFDSNFDIFSTKKCVNNNVVA